MSDLQVHQLQFDRAHASGAQEWCCATCGRRVLIQASPAFEKTVLAPGNQHAIHTGGILARAPHSFTNGEHRSYSYEYFRDSTADGEEDRLSDGLRPWLRWAQEAGLDDLWNQP